jgi:uncharacterized Ntn-hydrolase superfamily protein
MKLIVMVILAVLIIDPASFSQLNYTHDPFAHTFSIVARDPQTGEMGVAVQSHWFSVGTIVTWAEAGVGAIATQSFVNASFGPRGLEMLKSGMTAQQTVDSLLTTDEGREFRQLAIIDSRGNVASFTGRKCVQPAGNLVGDNFSTQANLMINDKVWPAMAEAFKNTTGPLAERMIAALEAGQEAGGDIRGKQSAAILIVRGVSTGKVWEDRLIDLRVDDNPEPIKELKRLLKVHRAYDHMNAGDLAVEKGDMKLALSEYSAAEQMFPDNAEMKFWHAVTLANNGKVDESLPIFKEVFNMDENWRLLTPKLVAPGLLTVDATGFKRIMELK